MLPDIVAAEARRVTPGGGRLAVLVPAGGLVVWGPAVARGVPQAALGEDPRQPAPVVVLEVPQAKGLEYDAVVVVDPDTVLAASPHGLHDLYVAVTRTTGRLGVVHTSDVPQVLARLRPVPSGDD